MSAATLAAVEDAIRAHIADENNGDLVTAFYCVAARYTDPDSPYSQYSYIEPAGQDTHISAGLLWVAQHDAFTAENG